MSILDSRASLRRLKKIGVPVGAGTGFLFAERSREVTYAFHAHREHQLLYTFRGNVVLRTETSRWLLPPEKAAWIPAGVAHSTSLDRADMISVFFRKRLPAERSITIFPAVPLMRELLAYSNQWLKHPDSPELQKAVLKAMELLCEKWRREELPFRLPSSPDHRILKVLDFVSAHLDSVNLDNAARANGWSERSLRRRFAPALGMGWQEYLHRARMLRAMELLSGTKQSVLEIALTVGYSSPSGFTTAFRAFTGLPPTQFRGVH